MSYTVNAGKHFDFTVREVRMVDDTKIIELYFARDERAIEETKVRYGRLLYSIANRILSDPGESEECENDTYLRTWNSIPPTRPRRLAAYLSKITRNLAINRLRSNLRKNPPEATLILDELAEMIPSTQGDISEQIDLRDAINEFLTELDSAKRKIFVQRYFYMCSIKEIAWETGMREGSVKSSLSRTRNSLRDFLTERGIVI